MDEADRAEQAIAAHLEAALLANASAREIPHPHQGADGTLLCADCDDPIPPERLRSLPGASRCIDCQGAYELDRRRGLR